MEKLFTQTPAARKQIIVYRQTTDTQRPRQTLCPVGNLLGKFYTELSEIFSCGGQIVADDGDVLFDVENHRGDIRTLVTNVFHVLPLHLHRGEKTTKKTV